MDAPISQESDQPINIGEYLRYLLKHKWLIIACFIIVLSVTIFKSLRTVPIYKATSTMVVENNTAVSPVTGQRTDYGGYLTHSASLNTHIQLIKSRQVIEKVIRILHLDQVTPLKPPPVTNYAEPSAIKKAMADAKNFLSEIKKNFYILIGKKEKPLPPIDRETRLIQYLSGKISVQPIQGTNLIYIHVWDSDPVKARDIANSVTSAYIEFNAAGKLKSSKDMLDWMTEQLYDTQKRLEEAEAAFYAYKENQQLFSMEGRQGLISQQINTANTELLGTRNSRMELETKMEELRKIRRQKGSMIGGRLLINNPLINQLYTRLLELDVEYNNLRKTYKDKHPKIINILGRMSETRSKMNEELDKEMDTLKSKQSVLLSKEEILQDNLSNSENVALETTRKELKYAMLQRNVETNKKLYNTLLSKIEASNIDENLDATNIRTVEEATIPQSPVNMNLQASIRKGALMGLFLGIGLAFLLEYMDQSIRTEEDIKKYLDLPILAMIPKAEKP